eukprot:597327-Ditylum_brightwellii.AAC.1
MSFNSSKKNLSCDIGSIPAKTQSSDSSGLRTPTSQVLAKALRSKLKKSHSISDRVIESERALAKANIKLGNVTHDLKVSRADTLSARKALNQVTQQLQQIRKEKDKLLLDKASLKAVIQKQTRISDKANDTGRVKSKLR